MKILIVFITLLLIKGYHQDPKFYPEIQPSIGKVWPKPKYERGCKIIHFIKPKNFKFVIVGKTCDILEQAIERYHEIISILADTVILDIEHKFDKSKLITQIEVNLTDRCEKYPYLYMDEWYSLQATSKIFANSIWGILRALETYSQLVIPISSGTLQIINIRITDSPRFSHRGLLLDTARHYLSLNIIFTILDGMAYNKLNVFHWHIVDDQSFPYQSIKFPELSENGAFMPSMVYTQENISNIIEYARIRGIRVVAEFDIPDHSQSWGNSHSELFIKCYHTLVMNPISKRTNNFLKKFFSEVLNIFPDKYMHLGGDEVDYKCWNNSDRIRNYINYHQISSEHLLNIFMNRIGKFFTFKSRIPIVWQEVAMVNNFKMPNNTIIQYWRDNVLYNLTRSGYRVLYSKGWYLDELRKSWEEYYICDPHNFLGSLEQKKLVIGGEACMWGEEAYDSNVILKIFPRVLAIAERLWSPQYTTNMTDAQERLEEQKYRMILRGIW